MGIAVVVDSACNRPGDEIDGSPQGKRVGCRGRTLGAPQVPMAHELAAVDAAMADEVPLDPVVSKQKSKGRLPTGWMWDETRALYVHTTTLETSKDRPFDRCGTFGCLLLDKQCVLGIEPPFCLSRTNRVLTACLASRPRSTGLHLFEEVEGSKRSRRQTCPLVATDPEHKQSYATPKPPVRGRGRGRGRGGQAAASSSAARGRGRGRGRGTKAKAASCDADATFHVAAIKAVRGGPPGSWEFLVSWEGYDEAHESWEPERNLLEYKAELEQVRGARHAQGARAGRAGRGWGVGVG